MKKPFAQPATLPDNPIRRLRLAARLVRGHHRELAQWLEGAVQQHVHHGTGMDYTLGFAGVLGRSPRFDVLRTRRNRLLSRALVVLHNDLHMLHREVQRYEERVPAALRDRAEPDPNWPLARQLIHRAYQQGLGVPGTLAGLRKTLRHTCR